MSEGRTETGPKQQRLLCEREPAISGCPERGTLKLTDNLDDELGFGVEG